MEERGAAPSQAPAEFAVPHTEQEVILWQAGRGNRAETVLHKMNVENNAFFQALFIKCRTSMSV